MGRNERKRRQRRRQALWLVGVLLLLISGGYTAEHWLSYRGHVRTVFVGDGTVAGQDRGRRIGPFFLELADTPAKRAKGLMFRKPDSLGQQEGMLFAFPEEGKRSFWMKNTFIPLDMIFVDRNRKVVGILEDVPILNTAPRTVQAASIYVIELHGGTAKREGIVVGQTVEFDRGVEGYA